MATAQTPPRPVPGIWPQTPAARPQLPPPSFSTSLSHVGQLSQPSHAAQPSSLLPAPPTEKLAPRPPEALKPAERAARSINDSLIGDTRFPDLDNYLSHVHSSEYEIQSSGPWAPFQKVRMYNIPDQIFEQYNKAQVSTIMGLFAELGYAWVAIDNALYMWDYTSPGAELLGFEGQQNSITAVKLVVPRAGVFLPTIKHVIVLATATEVMLLGLGTESGPSSNGGLTLFQTGITVSVRGLDISVIASSPKSGRIFFGGRTDNDIYELRYQQEERWFSNRSSKVCHTSGMLSSFTIAFATKRSEFIEQMVVDDSRDLLYTLSSQSSIRAFLIKQDGNLTHLVTKLASDTYANIGHIISQNETLNPKIKIVSISAVPQTEAARYHLVAVTATGYRIYLSATSSGYWSSNHTGSGSLSMQAHHVKTPPINGPTAGSGQSQPYSGQGQIEPVVNVHQPIRTLSQTRSAARYTPGYFFCFTAREPSSSSDTLFMSAPDAARLARLPEPGQPSRSTESAMSLPLGSRAEDIGVCTSYTSPTNTPAGYGNELAVQFDSPIPEIAILTNTGVHIIRRRRLVDILAALIQQGGGADGFQNDVNGFIRSYGRTETLSTALAVACGQGSDSSQVNRGSRINDPEVLEMARKVFIDYGGKPSYNQNLLADNSTPAIDTVRPSPRHAAVALYVARLLRSAWKARVAREIRQPSSYTVIPAVPLEKLRSIQEALSSLQRFFHVNKNFIQGLSGPGDLSTLGGRNDEVAMQGEHRALHSIVTFVSDTIEGLSFVLVLFDERVEEIVPLLPEQSRPQFLTLTFEELFSTQKGHNLAKELVKAIVNRNIAKGSNVETVAEALRRRCGKFCSQEDVIIFKAQEQLKRAAEAGNNVDFARNLLNESLKLFERVANKLPADYLDSAVKQYIDMHFFAGAISLVLKVAHEIDRANEALSWMTDGNPANDPRSLKFDERTRVYNLIHNVINAVDESIKQGPSFVDGRPTLTATRRNEAYDLISRSKDEVFLTNLYDWYLSQGWHERLLAIESPFIVTYLQRKAADDLVHADLLWKFYGQTNQFYEAARCQLQLAQSSFGLKLDRRIEYLSRARANASTYTPGGNRKSRQRLLQEIADLLDAANIQDELLSRLKSEPRLLDPSLPPERRPEVLSRLDGPILTISDLFNDYADNGGYYDICLIIYEVSDTRDSAMIKQTWQQYLQGMHDDAVTAITKEQPEAAQPQQPWEAIAEGVRSLGARLQLSESVFPVHTLIPILLKYAYEQQRNVAPAHWVVEIFLALEVPCDRLFDVLEAVIYSNEAPVTTAGGRKMVVGDLVYVVEQWLRQSQSKPAGVLFDGDANAARVDRVLEGLVRGGPAAGVDGELAQRCRNVRQEVGRALH